MAFIQNPEDTIKVGVTLPKEVHAMVVDGLAGQANWQPKIRDQQTGLEIDNPVTKLETARAVLISFVSQVVKNYTAQVSSKLATEQSANNHTGIMKEINEGNLIKFENL